MSAAASPLVSLQDAGQVCAEPKLSLNESGLSALRKALDRAETSGEDVVILVTSPNGHQRPLTVQKLPDLNSREQELFELAMS
jgi:hypothetical protein